MKERHKKFNEGFWEGVEKIAEKRGIKMDDLLDILDMEISDDDYRVSMLFAAEVGLRLKQEREAQGISLEEMAKLADVSIGEIQIVEEAPEHIPLAVTVDIMLALKLTPKQLYEGM